MWINVKTYQDLLNITNFGFAILCNIDLIPLTLMLTTCNFTVLILEYLKWVIKAFSNNLKYILINNTCLFYSMSRIVYISMFVHFQGLTVFVSVP